MAQARGSIKWAIYILSLLVVGPLAAGPVAALRDVLGGHEATALVGASLVSGVLAMLLPIAAAAVVGLIASRLIGARQALVAAGLVLAWTAWRSASIDGVMRATHTGGTLIPLSIEGGILGLIGIVLASLIWVVGTPPAARTATPDEPAPRRGMFQSARVLITTGLSLNAIVAGVVAGGIVTWLVAQEALKGQTIAAAVLAGIAAAGFGRAVGGKGGPASPVPAMIAMALLAVLGPISGLIVNGGGAKVVSAAVQGGLFALAMPMPLDWLAGAFWGIPIGLAWADSMVDHPEKRD